MDYRPIVGQSERCTGGDHLEGGAILQERWRRGRAASLCQLVRHLGATAARAVVEMAQRRPRASPCQSRRRAESPATDGRPLLRVGNEPYTTSHHVYPNPCCLDVPCAGYELERGGQFLAAYR